MLPPAGSCGIIWRNISPMTIARANRLAALVLALTIGPTAFAQPPCDAPPYGDADSLYSSSQKMREGIETLLVRVASLSISEAESAMTNALHEACEAKVHNVNRAKFYFKSSLADGFFNVTPENFDTRTATGIADTYLTYVKYHLLPTSADKAANAPAKSNAPKNLPGLYGILMCIDGAGCRFYDASMVFNGSADCERYLKVSVPPSVNIHNTCVPVQYSQSVH